ncbi:MULTISPECIES: hypothetical protein [unclassified Sphingomonas]|uniref:hypothetical protein n=1 Tax=Novosphingobium rhizosphaerae TaxID=1551649 RepID=UPI0015CBF155
MIGALLAPLLAMLRNHWRSMVPWAAVAILLALAIHERAVAEKRAAEIVLWRSAEHDWRRAATIMRTSYDTLHGALGMQNAAVQRLKDEGDARRAAGKAALDATAPRNAVREGLAHAIETAPPSAAGFCRTPDAVMAAKGEL